MDLARPNVLIIDDETDIRQYLQEALAPTCQLADTAADTREALKKIDTGRFDVLLCDICMPGASGLDLLSFAQELNWDCAIIIMTGHATMEHVVSSVRMHAADFLLKPFTLQAVINSVSRAFARLKSARAQRIESEKLSHGLRERTIELERTRTSLRDSYRSALETLVATLEAREPETYAHSFRVRAYATYMAKRMRYPAEALPVFSCAAVLHDIGKIAVPDSILLKPGKLTSSEFDTLTSHSVVGERIVKRMGFISAAATIIRHHHERFDGLGYPDKLRGAEIPLGSRIFAVADTLDAMTSNRCYRRELTLAQARAEIQRCSGTQFDPAVVEVFVPEPDSTWQELRIQADCDARNAMVAVETRSELDFTIPSVRREPFPAVRPL